MLAIMPINHQYNPGFHFMSMFFSILIARYWGSIGICLGPRIRFQDLAGGGLGLRLMGACVVVGLGM